ncbi:MAG: hypothetical protein RLN83_04600 [Balneola sp.]
MIEILILVSVGLISRFFLVNKGDVDFDTYGHLYFAKEIKRQKVGPVGEIKPQVISPEKFRQPFLWHWMVGTLSLSFFYKYKKWINAALDVAFGMSLYGASILYGFDFKFSFWLVILYYFTPIWFSGISTGPRIKSLTPRITSEIALNWLYILLLFSEALPLWIVLSGTLILGVFVLLSSKFGIQAFLFITPLIALFSLNILPIISLIGSILVAIIVTKGNFIKNLSFQLNHLIWYFKKNIKGEMAISNRNSIDKLISSFKTNKPFYKKLANAVIKALSLNSFIAVLFKMPIYVLALALTGFGYFQLPEPFSELFVVPVIAASILYVFINIPYFLFLGEAERYLNHVSFFIVGLFMYQIDKFDLYSVVYLLTIYGFLYWVFEAFILHRLKGSFGILNRKALEEKNIMSFLQKNNKTQKVLCFPYHAVGIWRIMYETVHVPLFPLLSTKPFAKDFEEKYGANYPYVKLDRLDDMASEYEIDILIIENKSLEIQSLPDWKVSSKWVPLDLGCKLFSVFKYKNS